MKSGIKIKGLKKLQKSLQPDAFIERALPDKFDLECPSCKESIQGPSRQQQLPSLWRKDRFLSRDQKVVLIQPVYSILNWLFQFYSDISQSPHKRSQRFGIFY